MTQAMKSNEKPPKTVFSGTAQVLQRRAPFAHVLDLFEPEIAC